MRADLLSQPGIPGRDYPAHATVVQRPVMVADIRSPNDPWQQRTRGHVVSGFFRWS